MTRFLRLGYLMKEKTIERKQNYTESSLRKNSIRVRGYEKNNRIRVRGCGKKNSQKVVGMGATVVMIKKNFFARYTRKGRGYDIFTKYHTPNYWVVSRYTRKLLKLEYYIEYIEKSELCILAF